MASSSQPAPPPPQSNWLQEWRQRTPVVTQYTIFTILPITLAGMLFSGLGDALTLTPETFLHGHVWRLVTAVPYQAQLLTLVFVVLMVVTQGPAVEGRVGSLRFLTETATQALLINITFAAISSLCFAFGPAPQGVYVTVFGAPRCAGLWPVLLSRLTQSCLLDPAGRSAFLCTTLPNRVFPWFLVAVFSALSFALQLDMLLGVVVGYAAHANALRALQPSPRWVAAQELGPSLLVASGCTSHPGYVYSPDTALPGDIRTRREAARAGLGLGAEGAGGSTLFGPQRGAAASAAGGGAPSSSSSSSSSSPFMFRAGRGPGGATAPSTSAGAGGAAAAAAGGMASGPSFGGKGQALGSASSIVTSGGASSSSSLLAPVLVRGAMAAAGAGPEAGRRAALAAAAEARASAAASRGQPSPKGAPMDHAGRASASAVSGAGATTTDRTQLLPKPASGSSAPSSSSEADLLGLGGGEEEGGDASDWEVSLAILESMGHSKQDAAGALTQAAGDLDAAIAALLASRGGPGTTRR